MLCFEKCRRGEISYVSNRCSKCSQKYLKFYDRKQESEDIMNLDVNNLYGYAMSNFFPTSGFKWVDLKEFDLNEYISNGSKRCALEDDLKYLKELRQLQNDYPLAPDKIDIKREMLSEYQLKISDLCNIPIGNVENSVPNFVDKENLIDYENFT